MVATFAILGTSLIVATLAMSLTVQPLNAVRVCSSKPGTCAATKDEEAFFHHHRRR